MSARVCWWLNDWTGSMNSSLLSSGFSLRRNRPMRWPPNCLNRSIWDLHSLRLQLYPWGAVNFTHWHRGIPVNFSSSNRPTTSCNLDTPIMPEYPHGLVLDTQLHVTSLSQRNFLSQGSSFPSSKKKSSIWGSIILVGCVTTSSAAVITARLHSVLRGILYVTSQYLASYPEYLMKAPINHVWSFSQRHTLLARSRWRAIKSFREDSRDIGWA